MVDKTENVRVTVKTLNKVRKLKSITKQSISGFATLAIEEKIKGEILKDKIRRIIGTDELTNNDMTEVMDKICDLVK